MAEKKKKSVVIKKINTETKKGKPATEAEVHKEVAELGNSVEDKKLEKKKARENKRVKKKPHKKGEDPYTTIQKTRHREEDMNDRQSEDKEEYDSSQLEQSTFQPIGQHANFKTIFEQKRKKIAEEATKYKHKYDCIYNPDNYFLTKAGNPTKFFREMPDLLIEYFEDSHWNMVIDRYEPSKDGQIRVYTMKSGITPTFEGFARVFRISYDRLVHYTKMRRYNKDGEDIGPFSQEWIDAYSYCKKLQKEFLLKATDAGLMKENRAKFRLSANHDMHEKKGLDINDSNETKKLKGKLKEVTNMTDEELEMSLEELTDT